ncbi:MAG: hypothetical protein ACXWX4_07060 [Actinomycetota bacterium]
MHFADGDELLDWILRDLDGQEPSHGADEEDLTEILAELRARSVVPIGDGALSSTESDGQKRTDLGEPTEEFGGTGK